MLLSIWKKSFKYLDIVFCFLAQCYSIVDTVAHIVSQSYNANAKNNSKWSSTNETHTKRSFQICLFSWIFHWTWDDYDLSWFQAAVSIPATARAAAFSTSAALSRSAASQYGRGLPAAGDVNKANCINSKFPMTDIYLPWQCDVRGDGGLNWVPERLHSSQGTPPHPLLWDRPTKASVFSDVVTKVTPAVQRLTLSGHPTEKRLKSVWRNRWEPCIENFTWSLPSGAQKPYPAGASQPLIGRVVDTRGSPMEW